MSGSTQEHNNWGDAPEDYWSIVAFESAMDAFNCDNFQMYSMYPLDVMLPDGMLEEIGADKNHHQIRDLLGFRAHAQIAINNESFDSSILSKAIIPWTQSDDGELLDLSKDKLDSVISEFLDLPEAFAVLPEPKAVIPLPDPVHGQATLFMGNACNGELQEAFRCSFEQDTLLEDEQRLSDLMTFGLHGTANAENGFGVIEGISPLIQNKDDLILCSVSPEDHAGDNITTHKGCGYEFPEKVVVLSCSSEVQNSEVLNLENGGRKHVTEKRVRKPNRRYTVESPEKRSRKCKGKLETPYSCSTKGVLCGTKYELNSSISLSIPTDESAKLPLFSRDRAWRGQKSSTPSFDPSDNCDSKHEKLRHRRKGKRQWSQWTLAEVCKLLGGISRRGIGKWSEIKRLHFLNSHRTATNLKDKWRGLLRVTSLQREGAKEGGPSKKSMLTVLPQSVITRIRALSANHPHLTGRKPKTLLAEQTSFVSKTEAANL